MSLYVFDTSIVSLILRRDPAVLKRLSEILMPDNHILGCPLVWHELRRGLLAKDAKGQMKRFEDLFATLLLHLILISGYFFLQRASASLRRMR